MSACLQRRYLCATCLLFLQVTQLMNARYISLILTAIFLAIVVPTVANASLANDSNAIIFGETPQFSYTATTPKLFGYVDYAVYAPGDYVGSLSLPADQYVYCYQIFVLPTSGAIGFFTVNLSPDATALNAAFDTASLSGVPGGSTPANSTVSQDFVTYNFGRNSISANNHSAVLLFTSDFAPQVGDGIVSGALPGTAQIDIPTPTPEPASMLILALGVPALLGRRRRKN
jgi:hypothetical protein